MAEENQTEISVLFVDDEEGILKSLSRLFKFTEYKVFTASSGIEGLEVLNREKIHIIVSDMRMPIMQGDEFLMKAKEVSPDTMRFILSGFADFQSTINALNNAGVQGFISKPWDDDSLIEKIDEAAEYIRVRSERDRLRVLFARQNRKLKELNKGLEERVNARTGELQQTADMLDLSYQEIKDSYGKFIEVFSQVLQMRSMAPNTYLHDVSETARDLAKQIGLNEQQQENIYKAGKLHELGKIGLPDSLLKKPLDEFTNQDWKVYKEYPILGYTILASLDHLHEVSLIIRGHCECVNGLGFPDRLKQYAISKEAQVLGICMHYYMYRHGMKTGKSHNREESAEYIQGLAHQVVDAQLIQPLQEVIEVRESELGKHEVRVSHTEVAPGMTLARDLFNTKGMIMLTKGTVLSEKIINKLQYLANLEEQTFSLYIYGFSIPKPAHD